MRPIERVISAVVLGVCAPVVLMLVGWWGSLGLAGDGPWIAWSALGGLCAGLLLDATLLRHWLMRLYELPWAALLGVALFYSVMVYGVFMGFPPANLLVGIFGGFVVGRRAAQLHEPVDQAVVERRRAAVVAAAIMGVLCCATAWLALRDPYTASSLRGMFALPFTPSAAQLVALTIVGGISLVAAEFGATGVTARWAARLWSEGT